MNLEYVIEPPVYEVQIVFLNTLKGRICLLRCAFRACSPLQLQHGGSIPRVSERMSLASATAMFFPPDFLCSALNTASSVARASRLCSGENCAHLGSCESKYRGICRSVIVGRPSSTPRPHLGLRLHSPLLGLLHLRYPWTWRISFCCCWLDYSICF